MRKELLAALMLEKVAPDTSNILLCPMPGLVKAILVTVGQAVKAGEPLAMVEAMKMENVLRAERDVIDRTGRLEVDDRERPMQREQRRERPQRPRETSIVERPVCDGGAHCDTAWRVGHSALSSGSARATRSAAVSRSTSA